MSSLSLVRWGGLAAIFGGMLGIVLSPLTTIAAWGGSAPMWWARLADPIVAPLFVNANEGTYAAYGKTLFFVYLLFLIGLITLHAWIARRTNRLGEAGFQVARVGLVMNLIGNVNDYWLGREVLGFAIWGNSFWIFTILGTFVYMVGSVLLGIATLRARLLPRWGALSLIFAPPLGILLVFWGMYHLPSSFVFASSLGWALLGYTLWSETRASGDRSLAS